jgi:hypothetical protein
MAEHDKQARTEVQERDQPAVESQPDSSLEDAAPSPLAIQQGHRANNLTSERARDRLRQDVAPNTVSARSRPILVGASAGDNAAAS